MLIERASSYEEEEKAVIVACLEGIITTINSYLLDKALTAKNKSIQEHTNKLRDIILEMKR